MLLQSIRVVDKYLLSPKHCCYEVPNQITFLCDIKINDWMWMFHLNFKNWFDFCNGYCNGWKQNLTNRNICRVLKKIMHVLNIIKKKFLLIFVLQEMLNNEQNPMVNSNYFSKCSSMHNRKKKSNKSAYLNLRFKQEVVTWPFILKEMEIHASLL